MDPRQPRPPRSQGLPSAPNGHQYSGDRRPPREIPPVREVPPGPNDRDQYYGGRQQAQATAAPSRPLRDPGRTQQAQQAPPSRDGSGGTSYSEWKEPPPRSRDRDARQQQREPSRNRQQNGYDGTVERRGQGSGGGGSGGASVGGFKAFTSYGKTNQNTARDLDEVLSVIERDWPVMTGDECVPVKVALELLDTSSLGKAYMYDEFQQIHARLQSSLQKIVNDHHQGFNSSIGTYHSILRSISSSQEKVRELRDNLIQAKEDLTANKPEMKNLVSASKQYDQMLKSIAVIQQLQLVPERLEARISEKRFLTAVEVLGEAMDQMKKPEMMEIGALNDLRTYLGSQETSLADILVEELHNHLYLKSPYCDDRWKPYKPGQKDPVMGEEGLVSANLPALQQERPLHKFLQSVDLSQTMVEDPNKNPEAESLSYIRLILEALNNLGYLQNAMSMVNQRLPVELFKLVDKTNTEVDQRHPNTLIKKSIKKPGGKQIDLSFSETDIRTIVLNDLLWTLYSKFEAVMEGHRVLHDVVKSIGVRQEKEELSKINGFLEVWQLVQSEMRSLLHDYLTASDSRSTSNAHNQGSFSLNNIVAGKVVRDKGRTVFKLESADLKNIRVKMDQDDLQSILKASVPGLVSESLRPIKTNTTSEKTVSDGAATGHKLLIEPNVFNMGLLLPPSLAFLQRVKEIVPANAGILPGSLTSFLDDFLVNVFLPSLEDTMRELFNQVISDIDAFQKEQNWPSIAKKPIMRGTAAFFNLIQAFCRMLETIPPDTAFAELIIDLLSIYYSKCCDYYKELVARPGQSVTDVTGSAGALGRELKTSAKWAATQELKSVMRALWKEKSPDEPQTELLVKETELELDQIGRAQILRSDVISDKKTLSQLALLYSSMKWLALKVSTLRHVEEPESFSKGAPAPGRVRRRWTLGRLMKPQSYGPAEKEEPILPMTKEVVASFDDVINSFFSLSSTCLFTLRTESRVQIIHRLQETLSLNTHHDRRPNSTASIQSVPTTDPNSQQYANLHASPPILSLNTYLVNFSEEIDNWVREREMRFLTKGLWLLIESQISRNFKEMVLKEAGDAEKQRALKQVELDLLVLHKNLTNVEAGLQTSGNGLESLIERLKV